MTIFCDSSFLVGFYDTDDQYHFDSLEILKVIKAANPQFIITDYIYDEALTILLSSHQFYGYLRSKKFAEDVFSNKKYNFIRVDDIFFQKANKIFFSFNKDKRWSFTDCTSFAVMEDYGIRNVLTFDKNFKEMGFKIIRVHS